MGVELVHVEGYYLLHHLPRPLPVPTVLGTQNVEYALDIQRLTLGLEPEAVTPTSVALSRLREHAAWREADRVVAMTEEDAAVQARVVGGGRVSMVANGSDHCSYIRGAGLAYTQPLNNPSAVYVGNYEYAPNTDAVLYFGQEILPAIWQKVPNLHFYAVGSEPPDDLVKLSDPRIVVAGRVEAVEPFLNAATVFVCPLRVGGDKGEDARGA